MRYRQIAAGLFITCLLGAPQAASAQPDPSCYKARDFEICRNSDGTMSFVRTADVPSATPTNLDPPAAEPRPRAAHPGTADRGTVYDEFIVEHARANNIRPDLIRAVVSVESAFNPFARSPKGALGLMQLMPGTARQFNVVNPFDPEENIRAGSSYLRQLLDRYDGNETLALAAYNAGPGAVDKYGQAIPPYRETRHYVNKVSGLAGDGENVVAPASKTRFYKVIEVVNGREVVTYTTRKP